jgi:hypothetical protein
MAPTAKPREAKKNPTAEFFRFVQSLNSFAMSAKGGCYLVLDPGELIEDEALYGRTEMGGK